MLLGGAGSFRNTAVFLDSPGANGNGNSNAGKVGGGGFVGCVRRLEINNKIYNFEPAERRGDALFGVDVGECPEDSCSSVPCQHGGVCMPEDDGGNGGSGGGVCQCPLGFVGEFCQAAVDVQVPAFNNTSPAASSHLTYFGLASSSPLVTDVDVVLRPEPASSAGDGGLPAPGLVLYNGDRNDGTGDFLALYLDADGRVAFAFDNGDGVGVVRYASGHF